VGADHGAGWIRYVLILFDSKETNRLITGVETTFNEVTVDSPSFRWKNEFETWCAMLFQRCPCSATVNIRRFATTPFLGIAPEPPLPRAVASIESP
jgi:hypothetical protein